MNRVRLSAATNIKETGKFIVAVLMALMLIYVIVITGQNKLDLKPEKIKHLSCAEIKMHLHGLDEVKELKRLRYESIEAYYRINCEEWQPQTIIVSPVCEDETEDSITCDFEGKCGGPLGGPATGTFSVKDGPWGE